MAANILKSFDRAVRRSAFLLLPVVMASGCGADRPETQEQATQAVVADTASAETYVVTGRIMSVTPDRDFLMIRHDAIDGFMDAMTMPFAVGDTALVTGLAAGDSVGFIIEVSRGEIQVTSIEKRP